MLLNFVKLGRLQLSWLAITWVKMFQVGIILSRNFPDRIVRVGVVLGGNFLGGNFLVGIIQVTIFWVGVFMSSVGDKEELKTFL